MPKYEELKAFRKQNLIPEYNDSSSEKTMLHREARALAISRLEESARTEEEFANVISWWDKLDDNRERRERYHEIGRSEVPLEWHASDYILPGNANYDMVLWQKEGTYGSFKYDLPVLNLNSAKNNGYAFQWFAMSLALLIIYLAVNTKKQIKTT